MTTLAPPRAVILPSTLMLPCRPESAGDARRMVRAKLAEWGMDGLADDAALIISELAANAAGTGCRRMQVTIRRPSPTTVRLGVYDGSRSMPCMIVTGVDGDAESGRGLALVHALTHGRWGAIPAPLGKTVWAELTHTNSR